MKKPFLNKFIGAVLLAASGAAMAQFGGLGNALGGKSGNSSGPSAEQIVSKYIGGTRSVMQADANMLAAFGLKDEADKAAIQAKNLTEGATKDSLEDAGKVQTASSKALEEKLSGKKVEMDAASKKQFAEGLLDLSKGVIQYIGMGKDVAGFKPSVTAIGGAAGSAIYIAKSLPDSVKSLSSTLKMAIDFSKENNIPIPKEANDATAML